MANDTKRKTYEDYLKQVTGQTVTADNKRIVSASEQQNGGGNASSAGAKTDAGKATGTGSKSVISTSTGGTKTAYDYIEENRDRLEKQIAQRNATVQAYNSGATSAVQGLRNLYDSYSRQYGQEKAGNEQYKNGVMSVYSAVKNLVDKAETEKTVEKTTINPPRLMEHEGTMPIARGNQILGSVSADQVSLPELAGTPITNRGRSAAAVETDAMAKLAEETVRMERIREYQGIPQRDDFDYERYQMGYIPPNGDQVLRAMSDEEKAVYRYIRINYGDKEAEEYYQYMKPIVESRRLEAASGELVKVGEEHPVAASVLSTMFSTTNALTGGAKLLYDAYKNVTDPNYTIDPYDQMNGAAFIRDKLREGTMTNMPEWGKFLYQTGMSIADTSTNAFLFGGTGGAIALGTGAAADTARYVKLRGGTDEQALGMGVIAGAAELLTEKMGFEQLRKLIGGKKENVFRAVLGHMTSEFGEEAGTEIANLFADWAIMQDKSQYAQMVEEFGGGEEGTRRAWWEMLKQVGLSGLGGALSGAAMGGSSAAIGKTYQIMQDHAADRRLTQAITKAAEQAAQNETAQNAPVDVSEAAMQVADRELGEEAGAAQAGAQEATEVPAAQPRTETVNQTANQTANQTVAEAPDAQKQQYMDTAKKYGEKYGDGAALVFARNYDGGDIQSYDRAFNALYTAGRAGLTLDKVGKVTDALTAGMSDVTKRAIMQAGANSAMSEVTPGVRRMYTVKATDVQKRQIAMLNEIGRKYGVEIDVVDSIRAGDYTANGMYNGGRKIVVALDAAEGAIVQAGVHELTHYLKRTDADAYEVLKSVVLDHLQASGTFDMNIAVSERRAQYAGQNMTDEDIIEEIVSEAVPTFLTDEKAVKAFVSENRPLAQKIRDFFVKFAQEIREIAKKYMQRDGAERYEIANLLGRSDALTEIARTFDAALEAASEAQEAEAGETVYAKGGQEAWAEFPSTGIELMDASKYSLTDGDVIEGYLEAVDENIRDAAQMYRDDKNAKNVRCYVGDVSDKEARRIAEIVGVDVSGYSRSIDRSAFTHIEKRHGLDGKHDQTMADLNDVARMRWVLDNYDTLEAARDENGELVYSKGHTDSRGNPAQVVEYSKRINGIYYVSEAVTDGKWQKLHITTAYMTKKEKSASQTPDASREAPRFTPENETAAALSSSISDSAPDVNSKMQTEELTPTETRRVESNQPVSGATETKWSLNTPAFRNWFGDSKIVNEDGSPKVMYHGSAASFTAFDKKKARSSGLYGRGFYFTDSDSHAGQYGSLYQVYLRVANPLMPGGSTVTRTQVKKFLEAVAENEDDYSIENYGTYDVGEILKKVYQKDAFALIQDINATAIGDFVEAVKLFNEVNGTKYDGIVVPTETVVFEPTQIKSATDNVGTYDPNNPDIRFSLSNTSPATSITDENQNPSLPVDVKVSEESVRAQARKALDAADNALTERTKLQIRGIANKIMRETGSSYSKETFAENMEALVRQYAEGGWTEETLRAVTEMAKKIIETSERADNSLREQYADVRKRLKESGIALTETQKQEAANLSGGYGEYRKSVFGTVNLKDEGMTLESLWNELSEQHPEIFTPGANEGDQVRILQEFAYLMRPKYENPYGMDMDGAALEMAMRIEGDIMGMIGARDAAKSMYGSAEKLRSQFEQEYREKLKLQKAERVQKFQQIAADLKAAKAKGDSAEQAKVMSRYRAAMKSTGLDEAYAEIRATLKAREEAKAETAKSREMREKVTKQASELMNLLAKPPKGKRIPTGLQRMVMDVLDMLDINGAKAAEAGRDTVQAKEFREKLSAIREFYTEVASKQSAGEVPAGMDGLMMAFTERNLEIMNEALDVLGGGDKFRLRDMNSEQLASLNELMKNIRHTVDSVGKMWKNHRYQSVVELGNASIEEMDERGKQKINETSAAGKGRDFLALDVMEPVSYGERLGEAGSTVIQSLMDGEKEKFAKVKAATEATAKMLKGIGVTGYDIGGWKRHAQTVTFGSGAKVKMTDAMIMSLYLTAQRPQGRQHLLGNGMRIPTTKETGAQVDRVLLSEGDLEMIAGKLDDKRRRLADAMQAYLSTDVAKWGNDVTQRLYLYDAFTEGKYWPLTSDPNVLKTQEPEGDRAFSAIINAGFTKPLNEKANNPVIITDAFDVFGRHIGEMASYAGYAEVMTDVMAWINYRQRTEEGLIDGTVKESIEKLLGSGGVKYLTKLVQDINGARRGGDGTQLAGLLRNYKIAAVAGKIRVAMQQPTSIIRAAAEINPIYLLRAMKPTRGSVKEMQKWSNLAWWKANGNYDIGIGKGMDEILWGKTKRLDAVMEKVSTSGGLVDPGKMDDLSWSRIWEAAKLEIKRKRKDLKVGSDEYFRAVTERFEAICDRTQVVDTVMHRSDMMRSKDGLTKSLTSFMSEPTKSFNMLMRSVMEAGRNPKDAKVWGKLARTTMAHVASVAANAAATALFDALKYRDDDDPLWEYLIGGGLAEDWTEQFVKAFMSGINPLENIPIISDIYAALTEGEEATLMEFQLFTDIKKAWDNATDYFRGENKKKLTFYGAVSPTVKVVSEAFGLPFSGLMANAEMLAHAYDPKLLQTKSNMQTMGAAYDKLYRAMADGNKKGAEAIRTEINKGLYGATPKNDQEIDTGIAKAMALTDERILKAWKLKQEGKIGALVDTKKDIMKGGFTDAQVTKAFNSVESYMTSEYRELLEDGKTEEAGALKAKAAKYGMELTEKPEKDMEKELEAKTLDYKSLFAAIRGGDADDIADAVEILIDESDAKTEDGKEKTVRNQVSEEFREEYIDMVRSGKTKDAEKLAEALEIVGFDEEDRTDWVKKDYRKDLKEAVRGGKLDDAEELIETMKDEYEMDAESIADSLRSEFKQEYIDLVMAGKDREADALAEKLLELNLKSKKGENYFAQTKLNKWVADWEKAQDEE